MVFNPLFFVLFVLASFGGTAVMIFAMRATGKARAQRQEMAKRNGWTIEEQDAAGGFGRRTLISDPDEGWVLTLYSATSNSAGTATASSRRNSKFEHAGLAIDQGMAVLGPDIPAKTAAMAEKMMASMGGDIGRWMIDKITGGLGDEIVELRTVASDAPGHLMATPGAEKSLDAVRFAPELNNARVGRNEMQQPIVMRGDFGLRVRLSHLLRKPKDIEDFIHLGRALSDNLRG